MRFVRREPRLFEVRVHDVVLRVRAAVADGAEARTNALAYWDQLHSYAIAHPEILRSKKPLRPDVSASPMVREMAAIAESAGVGPAYCFRAPLVDHVGRHLAGEVDDVLVSNGGDHYVVAAEPRRITAVRQAGGNISLIVRPEHGAVGAAISVDREGGDVFVVIADSCTRANAVVAGLSAICAQPDGFPLVARYVSRVGGVRGVLAIHGSNIVLLGDVQILVGEADQEV